MKKNIKLVEKLFSAWNSHNAQQVLQCYDDTFTREDVSNHFNYGKQALLKVVQNYMLAFPDVSFELEEVLDNNGSVTRTATLRYLK